MKYKYIRDTFLDFFQKKTHKIIPSFPIFLKNDPTLFFINAGMNPFKDYFLGHREPEYKRIVNIQKCLRVSGKHNDLENVGYDNYHHTMFEMLGNWSFGDYSRKETIEWAWELLIQKYNIPKNNIYISIFIGNEKDGLSMDKETLQCWKSLTNNILFFGKKENFWEMGPTGPCGPCSEIHVDLRNKKEKDRLPGKYLINKGHPKMIEIWNLVFIEFFRKLDGTLERLSKKHVDTGMGLERLCMVLQEKLSSYDTDIFFPMVKDIKDSLGKIYRKEFYQDVSIRIIADHLRAIVFSISDGQLPSNNGAGYVIRRILRRAVIYVTRFLCQKKPFIYKFVDSLVREMKTVFPELENKKEYIQHVIKEEESSFFKVLEKGEERMKHLIIKAKEKNKKIIDGSSLFKLYDTYGFPIKLSKMLAEKNNFSIDEKSFQNELLKQKKRSKQEKNSILKSDWIKIHEDQFMNKNENFIGYDFLECNLLILKYRKVENPLKKEENSYYELVFSKTPFYPEGGGQLGDTGFIKNEMDKIFIENTIKEDSMNLHIVRKLPSCLSSSFQAVVNKNRREEIEKNHTATHLLHLSLKKIFGKHIQQKGSYIGEDYLRFDFSHYKKITLEELHKIEKMVQELIFSNLPLKEQRSFPLKEAIKKGYCGIFNKKYKQKVRIITFGDSSELCIGTHVKYTGLIQIFEILSESSISYGIRRIKAITSKKAIQYLKSIHSQHRSLKKIIKYPNSTINSFLSLQKENKKLKLELKKVYSQQIKIFKKEYLLKSIQLSCVTYICDISNEEKQLNTDLVKKIILNLRNEISNLFIVIGFIEDNKPIVFLSISDSVINNKNIHAYKIIRNITNHIHGKSWGNSYFSICIGSHKDGLSLVLKEAKEYLKFFKKNDRTYV
ncbi:MAG: alanine--tRNA ligase [Flavobacteriales bacterium]|jgi:alanyl-tRNA synthetase|uniref:alanine--tRNA ligase n=1 Tax=Blattabacterium sp. (Mastotermes darwiniensis) TaxID=39768 RepID=UPI000231DF55|nr:alanine--tRNA ligase [Blattabacterium sp. (Mastotermes darwiniensis)]AER40365.1 alanyl-tRNA synthetase [Blattabacterium sp. (Mastotermes darwiniensis) str. MADAR]MDR1804914.1 alanine--tRNA ligase [Flavobacteriales bacterium]